MRLFLFAAALFLMTACGGGKSSVDAKTAPGADASDKEKVSYMAQLVSPDSLARFICYGALGKSKDGKIDTVAMAQIYALEIYQADEEKVVEFSRAFDETSESLPLTDVYKFAKMLSELDDTQLPLDMGLRYGARVRRDKISAGAVKADTAALAKAVDPAFFRLFVEAFETAVKN